MWWSLVGSIPATQLSNKKTLFFKQNKPKMIIMKIKIAEIDIVSVLIVLFVGIIGILSIKGSAETLSIACVSGLVGYLGGYVKKTNKPKSEGIA